MLPNGVNGYIRSMVRQSLTATCTIEVETNAAGSFGNVVEGWTAVASNVPCRLIEAGSQTSEENEPFAGQDSIQETYRLIVMHDVALDVGQRVTIDGIVYYVATLDTAMTHRAYRGAVVERRL